MQRVPEEDMKSDEEDLEGINKFIVIAYKRAKQFIFVPLHSFVCNCKIYSLLVIHSFS